VIAETRGDWVEASLRYRSISANYPGTIQSFEAPLRIAATYVDRNEPAAANVAYLRAIESYEGVISGHYSPPTKIIAEEYLVRTLVEMEKWEEAVDRLLALPEKYPGYRRFQMNYLTAASILDAEIGDKARAVEVLEICIKMFPETESALQSKRELQRLQGSR
jgi:tetratricopeptide (TPR) repeat protein